MSIFGTQPTIFGGNTGMTYEEVQRQRKIAEQLSAGRNAPRNVGEGLTAIGNALAGRAIAKRAQKRDAELRAEDDAKWASLGGFGANPYAGGGSGGGYGGGTYTPPEPPNPMDAMYPTGQEGPAPAGNVDPASGLDMGQQVEMDLPTGIQETAQALGMNPHDLATIISYETAGTFDPAKKGPTTQWGQHRGLIQFGEPQAQQYGVNWDDPLGSQLGADGAIVRYFKENGWQPGMGLMDAYSIVNAGGPGRFNASDANNGGAPGTVSDKVNNQMDAHRQKAAALLGGSFEPGQGVQTAQAGQMDMQTLAEIANSPSSPPGRRFMAQQLLQQQIQANDPQRQIALQLQQAQLDKLQRPDPGYRILSPEEATANGLPEGAYQVGPDNEITKIGGGGVTVNNLPPGQSQIGTIPQGYSVVKDETQPSGYRMVAIPGGPEDTSQNDAAAQANRDRSGGVVTEDITRALDIIQNDPNWTTGLGAVLKSVPGTQAKSLGGLLQTIKANVGFDRLQQMRDASITGGALGAINKTEMDLLQSVLGNLEQSLSPVDLERNLRRVNQIYMDIIHGPGNAPPADGEVDFSQKDAQTIWDVDISTLDAAGMDAFEARLKELGL